MKLYKYLSFREPEPISTRQMVTVLAVFLALYALLCATTPLSSYGFDQGPSSLLLYYLARAMLTGAWTALAYSLFALRRKSAHWPGFTIGTLVATVTLAPLASFSTEVETLYPYVGSAVSYIVTTGLLCITFRKTLACVALALCFLFVQLVADAFVLGKVTDFSAMM